MDTFKDELLKGFASKVVNKAISSSQMQNHQFDFQRFGNDGALTSILVNSFRILFQDLKMYLVSKYTFVKNVHL